MDVKTGSTAALLLLTLGCLGCANESGSNDLALANEFLTLSFQRANERLVLKSLTNHVTSELWDLSNSEGLVLYFGRAEPRALREAVGLEDFTFVGSERQRNSVVFDLEDRTCNISCQWQWEISPQGPYARSWLVVKNNGSKSLPVADVDGGSRKTPFFLRSGCCTGWAPNNVALTELFPAMRKRRSTGKG